MVKLNVDNKLRCLHMGVTRKFRRAQFSANYFTLLHKSKNGNFVLFRIFKTNMGAFITTRDKYGLFCTPMLQIKHYTILRRLRLNFGVLIVSAKGASKNLRYCTGERHTTSSVSNSRGHPPAYPLCAKKMKNKQLTLWPCMVRI